MISGACERGGALFVARPLQHNAGSGSQKLENNNDIKSLSSFLPTQIIVTCSYLTHIHHLFLVCVNLLYKAHIMLTHRYCWI